MRTLMKTSTVKNYLSQFMKKDERFFGYKASETGKYSDVNLHIVNYALEGKDRTAMGVKGAASKDGFVSVYEENGKLNFSITLYSSDNDTVLHELFVHNFNKIKDIISIYKKGGIEAVKKFQNEDPGGEEDHNALKNLDQRHEGVKEYSKSWKELQTIKESYKKEYENAQTSNKSRYKKN